MHEDYDGGRGEKGWACRMKVNSTASVGCRMGKEYYQGTRSMYGVIFE